MSTLVLSTILLTAGHVGDCFEIYRGPPYPCPWLYLDCTPSCGIPPVGCCGYGARYRAAIDITRRAHELRTTKSAVQSEVAAKKSPAAPPATKSPGSRTPAPAAPPPASPPRPPGGET